MKEKIQRQGKRQRQTNYYIQKSDYEKRKGLQGWRGFGEG